ncbi:MAG: hypothetical protein PHW72_03435 [Candidatus Pacebacteria bacterium]|nr:hypothetical protein [Candidatus Paceibacterota bacterium]
MLILGILDTVSALLLIRNLYELPFLIPNGVIIGLAAYLSLKAIIFIADVGSLIDLVGGILLIISLFYPIHFSITIIFAVLIGLKGILTMLSKIWSS